MPYYSIWPQKYSFFLILSYNCVGEEEKCCNFSPEINNTKKMITRLIVSGLAVLITAYFLDGVRVEPWWWAVIVAVVLGFVNSCIRPIVKLVALPINFLTLGLFTFVINALMVLLSSWLLEPHFMVDGFLPALVFSIVLTVVNWILHLFFSPKKK